MSADDVTMITGAQCRAGRALCDLSRGVLAELSGVARDSIRDFEARITELGAGDCMRLKAALEGAGVQFLGDDSHGGRGARLKFSALEAAYIDRLENEGGPAAEDDVAP